MTAGPATPYAEVIGDPIAHSKSPAIHRFWLERLGIAADYHAVRVAEGELAAHFAARRADPAWRGCNVTIPHKQAALAAADDASAAARAIGAANCIVPRAGAMFADNSDAAGFLEPLAGTDLEGRTAAVVGAGGAARAILHALASRGIGSVLLYNRDVARAEALLAEFGLAGEARALAEAAPEVALLVNASALGMAGYPECPVSPAAMAPEGIVYDIVYAPLATPLLEAAGARGLCTIDGLAMLIGQAAVAFELFFGAPPPRDDDAALREMLVR